MSQTVALYCPIPTARKLKLRLKNGKFKLTELGLERKCKACGAYWPYDTEFFYPDISTGDLNYTCKACYWERRRNSNKRKAK